MSAGLRLLPLAGFFLRRGFGIAQSQKRKRGRIFPGGKFQKFALMSVQLQGFVVAPYVHNADLDQL